MRVALVLRSGGVYKPSHVQVLARQIRTWLPGADVFCLADVDVPEVPVTRLDYDWPGWWSKMELFRPDISGDLLYFDLDTVIRGPLDDIAAVNRLTLLRDLYCKGEHRYDRLQSAVMYLPKACRAEIWHAFLADSRRAIRNHTIGGDQEFLEKHWQTKAARWQDIVGNQIVSYKVHCRSGIPEGARVICAHGKPKLWDVPAFQHLYR